MLIKEILVEYGDAKMPIEVPDTGTIFHLGKDNIDLPEVDTWVAAHQALANPWECPL